MKNVRNGRRRPAVAAMSSMYAVAALCSGASWWQPLSADSPTSSNGVVAVVTAGIAIWLRAARAVPDWLLHVLLGVGLACTTMFIVIAGTPQGSAIASMAYTWGTLYAAYYLSRRSARAFTLVSAAGHAGALLLNPYPGAAMAWLVITATSVFAGERLGRLLESLRAAARTDPLTGTLNRFGLEPVARRRVADAHRAGTPLTVVLIDLDDFKQVNDARGHAAGDELLVQLTARWQQALRECDVLARSGGDEFVLLLPDTGHSEAREVVGRLRRDAVSRWSYGLAVLEADEDFAACLARADRDLYRAKAGRARPATIPLPTTELTTR